MSSQNFVGNVLAGFTDAFRPLEDSLTSIDDFAALLSSFGWTLDPGGDFSQITSALRPVADALTAVDNAVQALRALGPDPTAEQIAGVIPPLTDAIKALVSAIRALATGPGFTLPPPTPLDKPEFWATFAQELLEWLLYMYVKDHQRVLFGILHFLGVLTEEEEYPAVPFRHNYLRRGVRWDRIPKIVTSPQGLFADVYGWGVAFDHPAFIGNLAKLLAAFELSVQVAPAPGDLLDIYYDPGVPARGSLLLLSGPVYSAAMTAGSALGYVEGDLGVMPIPPSGSRTQDPAGFSLFPIISGQLGETIHIVDGLDLSLKGGFESDAAVRVEIRPDGVNVVVSPSLGAKIDAHASLQAQPSKPWILIGAEGSTRLELSSAHVGLSAAGPVGNIEYIIEVGADKAALVIDFGEGDGFLQQMLGGKPQSLDLGVVAGWSSKSGLRFSGQAQLEANIPVHLSIAGVLAVDTIYIKFRAGTDAKTATLEISAAGGLTLGPVAATVDRVGLAINCRAVDPKTDPPGNLGDLNLGFGFKAPNGLGLLIDTGAVVGGGYIFCDPEKGQYTGVLELSAEALQIKVIGILNTVLPGGQTGFSLLLIVSAEFEPIQLGFGFTLSGVGGLAGVNRTMVLDALRTGLKNHTLNSILFPKDPIVHAQQIISDLQTVFPPQQNRYVFGPMLEIGWGVPTIILAELGIVLELPAPVRLAILGQMTAVLPEENAAIVLIHLDVLGTVDFEKKFLTIDATLYDSRVTVYTLLGDMALRMIWGENANFALSVGGLNPRFQPPAGFPSLKRLTLSLGSGANPRLSCDAYFALTSNTVQFGAGVNLYASAAGFNVEGYLNFDALFVISPFHFNVEIQGGVDLKQGGSSLMSISLDLMLDGPNPWHVVGTASAHILFFTVSVGFDQTFGDPTQVTLPGEDPTQKLLDALQDNRSWNSLLPPDAERGASLVAPNPKDKTIVVHPLSMLGVTEKVLPLGFRMTRFGSGVPMNVDQFDVGDVTLNGVVESKQRYDVLTDQFAPGQFKDLSEDEKLSLASFERQPSGLQFNVGEVASGTVQSLDVEYETILVDDLLLPGTPVARYTIASNAFAAQVGQGAAQFSSLRNTGKRKFVAPGGPDGTVSVGYIKYVPTSKDDLSVRSDIAQAGTYFSVEESVSAYAETHPGEKGGLQITPVHELVP